jgi:hypothetical protein
MSPDNFLIMKEERSHNWSSFSGGKFNPIIHSRFSKRNGCYIQIFFSTFEISLLESGD